MKCKFLETHGVHFALNFMAFLFFLFLFFPLVLIKGRTFMGKAAHPGTFEIIECYLMSPEKASLCPFLLVRVPHLPTVHQLMGFLMALFTCSYPSETYLEVLVTIKA